MLKVTTASCNYPKLGWQSRSVNYANGIAQTERSHLLRALPALLLVAMACDQSGQIGTEAQDGIEPQDGIELQEQAYGANVTTDVKKAKGHAFIMLKALQYLKERKLLPLELQDQNAARNLVFGVNFADDTWLGRPGQYNGDKPAYIWNPLDAERWLEKNRGKTIYDWTTFYAFSPDRVNECVGLWNHSFKYRLSVDQRMVFAQGTSSYSNNVSPYLTSKRPEDDRPATFHRTCFEVRAGYLSKYEDKPYCYTTDNMFHYPLGESDLEFSNTGNISSTLKVYPLSAADLDDNLGAGCVSDRLRNLKVLNGSKIGLTKYGSILYQMSRRFFDNNTNWPAPDISQLIKAGNGNDISPEWINGWFELDLSIFSYWDKLPPPPLKNMPSDKGRKGLRTKGFFPHTYLGGNPFICTGGDNVMRDTCATGSPTWPVWVPKEDYSPATKEVFKERLSARFPERSNQAAQIYLGWASHMIMDSNLPHHAANWASEEHKKQDEAMYDKPPHNGFMYICPQVPQLSGRLFTSQPICKTYKSPLSTEPFCKGVNDKFVSPDACYHNDQKIPFEYDTLPEVKDALTAANFPTSASDVDKWCNSLGITDASLDVNYINYKASYNLFKESVLNGRNLAIEQVDGRVIADGLGVSNGGLYPHQITYFSKIMASAMVDTMKLLICAPPRSAKPPANLANGARCQEDTQCDSGFCTDGVCCNERCSGVCRSCNQPTARSIGWCLALRNGERDALCPGSESGYTGICNGDGTCNQLSLPGAATSPNPANGANGVSIAGVVLKWTAGGGAITHDVYFGTPSNSVKLIGSTPNTLYSPGKLQPNTTYSWSITEKNSRGQTQSSTWSFTTAGALPGVASKPSPADDATGVSTSTVLKWTAGSGATSHDVYLGETAYGMVLVSTQTGTSFTPNLQPNMKYFWAITEKNSNGETPGEAWQFTTAAAVVPLPGAATSPSPAKGAKGISVADVVLKWTAGGGAITHDVYFGTPSNSVKLIGSTPNTFYSPGKLQPNTTYSWYITEKNSRGQTKGSTWSFTTAGTTCGLVGKQCCPDPAPNGEPCGDAFKYYCGASNTCNARKANGAGCSKGEECLSFYCDWATRKCIEDI